MLRVIRVAENYCYRKLGAFAAVSAYTTWGVSLYRGLCVLFFSFCARLFFRPTADCNLRDLRA